MRVIITFLLMCRKFILLILIAAVPITDDIQRPKYTLWH